METTHTYILEVVDTDSAQIIYRAETFTADSMIEEVAKAQNYINDKLTAMDQAAPTAEEYEPITTNE